MSDPAQPSASRMPWVRPKILGLRLEAPPLGVIIDVKPAKRSLDVVLRHPSDGTVADWLCGQLSEQRERALRLGQPWHEFAVRDLEVRPELDPQADYRLWMITHDLLAELRADLNAGLPLWSVEQLHKASCVCVGYYEVVLLESDRSERPTTSLRDRFASAAEYLEAVADQVAETGGTVPRVGRPTLVF